MGLGHLRRNLALAGALSDASPGGSVLLAASAETIDAFRLPPHVDVLRLPGIRKVANERYEARRLQVAAREIRRLRASLLSAAVEAFRPSAMIVDKHPLGALGELRPALDVLHSLGGVALLGLRDVLDDPATVQAEWERHDVPWAIRELYQHVLVYGHPAVVDPVQAYGLPGRVHYCGYVVEPEAATSNGNHRREQPLVLATAGGGEDGAGLLETFVAAAARAPRQAAVVAGPLASREAGTRLEGLAERAGVEFHSFLPDLAERLGRGGAPACMGGYNTLGEGLVRGTPTVCVPRVEPRTEQLIRARAFARLGLLQVVE